MAALTQRNVSMFRGGVAPIADVDEATSPDQLERALARLMAEHVRPGGAVNPSVTEDLVATRARFGMRMRTLAFPGDGTT